MERKEEVERKEGVKRKEGVEDPSLHIAMNCLEYKSVRRKYFKIQAHLLNYRVKNYDKEFSQMFALKDLMILELMCR